MILAEAVLHWTNQRAASSVSPSRRAPTETLNGLPLILLVTVSAEMTFDLKWVQSLAKQTRMKRFESLARTTGLFFNLSDYHGIARIIPSP